jgi:hypothetical protein
VVKLGAIVTRDVALLVLEAVGLLGAVAWCRAVGCDDRWMTGSTTMTRLCSRCGRVSSTIPRR